MALNLGSLLGGGGTDPQAAADIGRARQTLTLQQALSGRYGQLAATAGGHFGADDSGYRQAVGKEASYLESDPWTDQRSTEALADATAGTARQFQRSNALLEGGLASRGITDGSALAGGLADNARAFTGQQAEAENALARQKIATADANRTRLVDLLGGEANQDYGRETGAMGAEGSLNGSVFSGYDGLGQQEQQRADQQGGGLLGLIGGVASVAGQGGYGSLASFLTKKKAPTPSTINYGNAQGNPSAGGWYDPSRGY